MDKVRYVQHPGKVIAQDSRFEHMMAITLDPTSGYLRGVIRCIASREGKVGVAGSIDRSALHFVSGDSLEHFTVGDPLNIKGEKDVVGKMTLGDSDFLGLEDPDIWVDEKTVTKHLYFTIPIRIGIGSGAWWKLSLGHAVGESLDSLAMTAPLLEPTSNEEGGAKEVCIAPINRQGFRYNLVESSVIAKGSWYSTARVAIAEDMGKPWRFGATVFHPAEHGIEWIAEHASPGPLFSKNFIDVGAGKALGVINGREASRKIEGKTHYAIFSVGLFIYDYENGKIEWVSPEPLIRDSEAETITFASQFVEQGRGRGILYAHVDDSFVRAYTLEADKIKPLIP